MESIVKYNETLFVILKCCQEFIVSVNLQQRQKVSAQYCRAIPADCGTPWRYAGSGNEGDADIS